jgi:hypothetical protein
MNRFHQDLQEYPTTANSENNTILRVVTKMREMSNLGHVDVRSRIANLEAIVASVPVRPPSPPTPSRMPSSTQMLSGFAGVDGNTPLGVAMVGGSEVIISANYLLA